MTTRYGRKPASASTQAPAHFPASWQEMADLRVLKTRPEEWDKLSTWCRDMTRRGWSLLKITTTSAELLAVFGKTRARDTRPVP